MTIVQIIGGYLAVVVVVCIGLYFFWKRVHEAEELEAAYRQMEIGS